MSPLLHLRLATRAREAKARLLMQLAYVATRDADELAEPWAREAPPSPEDLERAAELTDVSDLLAVEAERLCPTVAGLADGMLYVVARYEELREEENDRRHAELLVADLIFIGEDEAAADGEIFLGERSSVGRYRATASGIAYACLDLHGFPVGARGEPVPWTPETRNREWTADRAAALFVAREGSGVAYAVADRLDELAGGSDP